MYTYINNIHTRIFRSFDAPLICNSSCYQLFIDCSILINVMGARGGRQFAWFALFGFFPLVWFYPCCQMVLGGSTLETGACASARICRIAVGIRMAF